MEEQPRKKIVSESMIAGRISTPMTDADLERHTGIKGSDIIKYSDLKNYNDITDLLPTDKSARIILIEDKYNSGHWVAILRYGKTIEYFNSYGAKWDTDWKFVNKMMRMILGENTNEMTRLMDKAKKDGWDTVWNEKHFQALDSKIQTCGRWCVFRIEMMKMGYNLKEFQSFVKKQSKEQKISTDYLVAKYVE
jgi:hypothetical protein